MDEIYAILQDVRPEFDFKGSDDYISDGLLDSFDMVYLVTLLEEGFGIKINALDILPENFMSAAAIGALVAKSQR